MKKIIAFAGLALVLTGCYNDKYNKLYPTSTTTVTCDTTAVSFSSTIQPILNANCITCHAPGGAGAPYGDYTSYTVSLSAQALIGNMVRDISITNTSDINHMPQSQPSLSACDISKITAWVNQGALNN
jgi:hypothetical protein